MINYREQYKRLLSEFERLGGNLQGVPRIYSLENEAKLRREMSKLTNSRISKLEDIKESHRNQAKPKEDIVPMIADFPPTLHPIYFAKKNHWL